MAWSILFTLLDMHLGIFSAVADGIHLPHTSNKDHVVDLDFMPISGT